MGSKTLQARFGVGFGTDPELFIVDRGGKRVKAVPSEQVIPAGYGINGSNTIVRDGVQCEFRAGGGTSCRQSLSSYIHSNIVTLNNHISHHNDEHGTKFSVSFAQAIRLTKGDLANISPESRQLNCKPSLNAYGREMVQRNGDTYPIRTASGHLHLATDLLRPSYAGLDANDVVKLMDVWVGIPCVLLARHKAEALRRKTYGRAGEYRLPSHGIEYRTPSNFWLAHYQLQSMIFGLARQALNIAEGLGKGHPNSWAVNLIKAGATDDEVETAINTNDFDAALDIYSRTIRPVIDSLGVGYNGPLQPSNILHFEYLVETGLAKWFSLTDEGILNYWTKQYNYSIGWERFLNESIQLAMPKTFTGICKAPEQVDLPLAA